MEGMDVQTIAAAINMSVGLGYIFTTLFVLPNWKIRLWDKIFFLLFLLGCGMHHMELAYHTFFPDLPGSPAAVVTTHQTIFWNIVQIIGEWAIIGRVVYARLSFDVVENGADHDGEDPDAEDG